MSALNRVEVVQTLLKNRGDLVVIAGLGAPAYNLAACGDAPLDFPLWGAMGGAAMVGLGLALAQPDRKVLVLTGDGEMLMGLGGLAVIGVQQPANLRIVVLDNEVYGETGEQSTHTGAGVDLVGVASACGINNARTLTTMAEVAHLQVDLYSPIGPLFAVVKISPDRLPKVLPPRDGPFLAHRLRAALLGEAAALE